MKEKKVKNFWQKLWLLLNPSHKEFWVIFVLIIIVEIFALAGPYILKMIIDNIIDFNVRNIKYILLLVFLFFIGEQSVSLTGIIKHRKIFKILFNIEAYLHVQAQEKLMELSLSYHEKENTGNKITKIEKGAQKINDLVGNMLWEVIPTIIKLFVTLLIMLYIDWRFGVLFVLSVPLFVYITYKSNKKIYPLRKQRYTDYEKASGIIGQSIININTVKSFVQEKMEIKKYKKLWEYILTNGIKEWSYITNHWISRDIVIDFGRVSMLLMAVYLVFKNNSSVGMLVFVVTLSERAYFSMYRLSRFYDKVEEGVIAVDRFSKMLNEKSEIVNTINGIKPKNVLGHIEFNNVCFKYKESKERALDSVSLKISSGCVTALIGPSGGGKTTLARMIYRHYDPQKGAVKLDEKDLREYDLYSFRKFIAIVPQEVEIFNMSVRDNIAYAKPNASMNEIRAAARIANADEFIEKLSQKYDTEVGERGIKLSGGQRQRVGIARAILANPRILIFDEATSNLDSYSERLIQEAMDKISKGRTMIIIAHRLSTIKKADKIIVLENGKIVEQGNHIELSRVQGGLYAKLLNLQKMGDVE